MTHAEQRTCARGCRTPDGRREPVIGRTQLCGRCHRQFPQAVNDLGDLWPVLLDSQISSGTPSVNGRVQSSNRVEADQLWRPQVTGILAQVEDWTSYMRQQVDADPRNRIQTWPTSTRVVLYALGRPAAARYFTHAHELAPAFVDEALKLRHRAHAVLNSDYVRRYPLGVTCRHPLPDDEGDGDHPCGAALVATIEPNDSGRDSNIRCTTHPTEHRVAPQQWAELGDYVEELRGS